jgi:hypothetical protein
VRQSYGDLERSRSKERRSRITRMSRDGPVRESIDEIMRQMQPVRPTPQPVPCQEWRVQQFRERVAVVKIQRFFKAYLFYKRIKQQTREQSAEKRRNVQLRKILAAKVIVRHVKRWLQVRHEVRRRLKVIAMVKKI